MSETLNARKGYQTMQKEFMSDKAVELRVFMSVTAQLKAVDLAASNYFIKLSEAIVDNSKLWKIIFLDMVNPENPLPLSLKEQLIGLAEFSGQHGRKVLLGEAKPDVLIDINTSIIAGLRQSLNLRPETTKITEAA